MKHVKLILSVAIIASVAGAVIWHLMWMTEIEKKFRTEQSSGTANKIEVKEDKNKDRRGKTEKNRPVAGDADVSVQESRTEINQAETPHHETEKPGGYKSGAGTVIPGSGTTTKSEKDTGKWFEKDIGLGKKGQKVEPGPGKTSTDISNDRTMSISMKNRANPVMQKNITQPQPTNRPDVNVNSVAPHSTSTAP